MRNFLVITLFACPLLLSTYAHAWEIDFSRRQKKPVPVNSLDASDPKDKIPGSLPAPTEAVSDSNVIPAPPMQVESGEPDTSTSANATATADPSSSRVPSRLDGIVQRVVNPTINDRQEFVILNTSHGFIPSNVRLHKGLHYTVHVVNVNEDKKNVSFMLDAFGQHHATYFGKIKSFELDPNKEGIFEFQCPETSAQGKLVIFGNQLKVERHLSSTP